MATLQCSHAGQQNNEHTLSLHALSIRFMSNSLKVMCLPCPGGRTWDVICWAHHTLKALCLQHHCCCMSAPDDDQA